MNIREYKKLLFEYIYNNQNKFKIGISDCESIAIKDDKIYVSMTSDKDDNLYCVLSVSPISQESSKQSQYALLDTAEGHEDEALIYLIKKIAFGEGQVSFNVFEGE